MVDEGFLKDDNKNMLQVSNSIEELFIKMEHYIAPKVSKIVNATNNK
mgnify:FL=1